MLFLTSRAKTSISDEGIELCWTPGAIQFAKTTCAPFDDGEVGGKFTDNPG